MMVSRCLMRQIRRHWDLGKLDAIAKTGRDNTEVHINCMSVVVAGVHKHRGGRQDAL